MTAPQDPNQVATGTPSSLLRSAIWVAIGALIAAAIVCVIWVLVGPEDGIIGRAFLTILLLAAFAGVAILDANLAGRRPAWFALASMVSWVLALLAGAFLIWIPENYSYFAGLGRFFEFLLVVLILQLALLHVRLFIKSHLRRPTTFSRIITIVTVALVIILAVSLIVPVIAQEWIEFDDLYWRIVVALTILAAVSTALVPLTNALFAPRQPRAPRPAPPVYSVPSPYPALAARPLQPWPTYADGFTPLPVLPDGTPDVNAYYTGYPSPGAEPVPVPQQWQQPAEAAPWQQPAVAPQADPQQWQEPVATWPEPGQQPPPSAGYQGFPPPPPVPPRS